MQNLVWKKSIVLNQFFPQKSKDWDRTSGSNTVPIAGVLVMWAEIGHHLLCIYVSCRYEIHEGRADTPSVRIRPHVYTFIN